jgi:5-methyltetrahydropteroyltriglutamate--homocysteine methyltransferase
MIKNNLGFPRIGANRELKKACESFWAGELSEQELLNKGKEIRLKNWNLQKELGIELIPSNDFSFYDQVLDHSCMFGLLPSRFEGLKGLSETGRYFAMARGLQKDNLDVKALQMTKWFDTNYHYMVPEFEAHQSFHLANTKILDEYLEAKEAGIQTKPVLIGPITYLLLGKVKQGDFKPLDLLERLLPVYLKILTRLQEAGAEYVQIDEPFLALDIDYTTKEAYRTVYHAIKKTTPELKIILTTYFEGLENNALAALNLPVDTLHLDLIRGNHDFDNILSKIGKNLKLSLGIVDGRNIWKSDYKKALEQIRKATDKLGKENVMIAPSCSLLHVPIDLDAETRLNPELKNWMAFAKQKLNELNEIDQIFNGNDSLLDENQKAIELRKTSNLIHNNEVKNRIAALHEVSLQRNSVFADRAEKQRNDLKLPLFPTTTIGSFPQSKDIRILRRKWKKGELSENEYNNEIKEAIRDLIKWQEETNLDVLVHGEFERNDMVEYFGELLNGFVFTQNGWVQSYGSRCVKPPIIFGDIERKTPMTVDWSAFAQSLSSKPVKGMLTGPITIMKWSFVRDDQDDHETRKQISLAIRDEVEDLEKAGIRIIQIDEAAYREAMPLRESKKTVYIEQATEAFRIASSGVKDETQIHTHMCYSDFRTIVPYLQKMDADVITIEMSRSQMIQEVFRDADYTNDIGPGVYDIHSPRVPAVEEMTTMIEKIASVVPKERIWVNPDCGLKTRGWSETRKALENMVEAARQARAQHA